jgi:hypothetical protein
MRAALGCLLAVTLLAGCRLFDPRLEGLSAGEVDVVRVDLNILHIRGPGEPLDGPGSDVHDMLRIAIGPVRPIILSALRKRLLVLAVYWTCGTYGKHPPLGFEGAAAVQVADPAGGTLWADEYASKLLYNLQPKGEMRAFVRFDVSLTDDDSRKYHNGAFAAHDWRARPVDLCFMLLRTDEEDFFPYISNTITIPKETIARALAAAPR